MSGRIIACMVLFLVSHTSFSQSTDTLWSLQKCIDYAFANNISLKQTELNTETSKVTLEQSQANRIPAVTGSASHAYSFGRSIDPFSNQFINQNIRSNNFNISASLVLFNGFQVQNQIRANKLSYEASQYDVEASKSNLVLAIVQYYYQILLAQEQVENARVQIASTESQIERTEKQVRAGSVAELNLIQLQSQLASDRVTLTNAENQVYLSKVALMQTLNLPLANKFYIEIPAEEQLLPAASLANTEEVYERALSVQPSIRSLQIRKESSVLGLKAARGSKYPRLSLNGQVFTGYSSARTLSTFQGYQTTNIGFLQSDPNVIVSTISPVTLRGDYPFSRQLSDNLSQSISLNLTIPILNNRTARSNVDRANINRRVAELNEESGKIQLRQNVEQAYANMRSAENTFNASRESLSLLEQTYKNAERRFSLGLMSPYDFLIQKNNYNQSRYSLSQAKYQYILNSKVLEFYQKNQL